MRRQQVSDTRARVKYVTSPKELSRAEAQAARAIEKVRRRPKPGEPVVQMFKVTLFSKSVARKMALLTKQLKKLGVKA